MRHLVLSTILALAISVMAAGAAIKPPAQRKAAPAFSLKDTQGKTVRLADYKGKIVLVNFWATWCGPCKHEMPWFVEFQKKWGDKGLVVLGISADEEFTEAKEFAKKQAINYPILEGTEAVMQLYGGVEALPASFLLDRDLRIASTHTGLVSKSIYERELEELLK
jgi:peroxiredoxin